MIDARDILRRTRRRLTGTGLAGRAQRLLRLLDLPSGAELAELEDRLAELEEITAELTRLLDARPGPLRHGAGQGGAATDPAEEP